jgi:hypothetical protein
MIAFGGYQTALPDPERGPNGTEIGILHIRREICNGFSKTRPPTCRMDGFYRRFRRASSRTMAAVIFRAPASLR